MKGVLKCVVAITVIILSQGCVMICPSRPYSSATGKIEGEVVDVQGKPVAGAEVMAIYLRGWTTWYPPVPNGFVVGEVNTDGGGRFFIMTKKRVDALWASSRHRRGELVDVQQERNRIILKP